VAHWPKIIPFEQSGKKGRQPLAFVWPMELKSVLTGFFKLDGGAMFGVVPKVIWNRVQPADEKNLCTWAMRCLLIEDGNKLWLIDNGIGNKQSEKFFSYYDLSGTHNLVLTLGELGLSFRSSDR
jgi:hypothetical protein